MLNTRIESNIMAVYRVTLDINPASVPINTSAEQTFSLPGLRLNDEIIITKPTQNAGFVVVQARCSAKDTLAVQFANVTAGALDMALQTYSLLIFRPDPDRLNADISASP